MHFLIWAWIAMIALYFVFVVTFIFFERLPNRYKAKKWWRRNVIAEYPYKDNF